MARLIVDVLWIVWMVAYAWFFFTRFSTLVSHPFQMLAFCGVGVLAKVLLSRSGRKRRT